MPIIALAADDFPETALWEIVRDTWGETAGPDNTVVKHEDVTCDGVADYVAARVNQDSPDGVSFDILLVTHNAQEQGKVGEVYHEFVSLPFAAEQQYGLCGTPPETPAPEVKIEDWTEKDIKEQYVLETPVCGKAIAVIDGMCDSPRFFWSTEAPAEGGQRLIFVRH